MKRIAALLFALLLLFPHAAMAVANFEAPVIPTFTADYGLYEFYQELEQDWGAVIHWSVEQKAWLSSMRTTLYDLEAARCEPLGWAVDMPFPVKMIYHQHGLPDETAIDQQTAQHMAIQHIVDAGLADDPSRLVSPAFYYFTDDPLKPVWHFRFTCYIQKRMTVIEIYMDAHTGAFAQSQPEALAAIAFQHLLDEGVQIARKPLQAGELDNYTVNAYYHPDAQQWQIKLLHTSMSHEFTFIMDDLTQTVLELHISNG